MTHTNSLFTEPDLSSWGAVRPEPEQILIPEAIEVPGIWNDEGGLTVGELDGKHYWAMEGYDSNGWQEIPEYLYRALVRFVHAAEREGTQ